MAWVKNPRETHLKKRIAHLKWLIFSSNPQPEWQTARKLQNELDHLKERTRAKILTLNIKSTPPPIAVITKLQRTYPPDCEGILRVYMRSPWSFHFKVAKCDTMEGDDIFKLKCVRRLMKPGSDAGWFLRLHQSTLTLKQKQDVIPGLQLWNAVYCVKTTHRRISGRATNQRRTASTIDNSVTPKCVISVYAITSAHRIGQIHRLLLDALIVLDLDKLQRIVLSLSAQKGHPSNAVR